MRHALLLTPSTPDSGQPMLSLDIARWANLQDRAASARLGGEVACSPTSSLTIAIIAVLGCSTAFLGFWAGYCWRVIRHRYRDVVSKPAPMLNERWCPNLRRVSSRRSLVRRWWPHRCAKFLRYSR